MRRVLTTALIAVLFAGCGPSRKSTAGANGDLGTRDTPTQPLTPTQLAAYAGNAKYPNVTPVNDLRAAAIVSRDRSQIKIYNFDRAPLRTVNVWVNGSFVQQINGIAPQSKVTIFTNELYDGLGFTFASKQEEVARVQLETSDGLYNLMGPAAE
jgi:hypothetical protein